MSKLKRLIPKHKAIRDVAPIKTPHDRRVKIDAIGGDDGVIGLAQSCKRKYLGQFELIFLYVYYDELDMRKRNSHTRIRIGTDDAVAANGLWPGTVEVHDGDIEIAYNESYQRLRQLYADE